MKERIFYLIRIYVFMVLMLMLAKPAFMLYHHANHPFTFSDLTSIRAGLAVAGDYDVRIDWRILLAIVFMIADPPLHLALELEWSLPIAEGVLCARGLCAGTGIRLGYQSV